ncbi:hypothetical protein BH18ACT15_BH18ACT15_10760 [soil metagenome]
MRAKTLVVAVAAVLLLGGAAYGAMQFFAPSHDEAISLVPEDSIGYMNLFLDPSTAQKMALQDLLGKFPEIEATGEPDQLLGHLVDEGLKDTGLTYEKDVQTWLGKQISGFVLAPESAGQEPAAALLVATTDEGATRAAIAKARAASPDPPTFEEKTHAGVKYSVTSDGDAYGVFSDFLVAGTEAGVEAAIDTSQRGTTLEDSDSYKTAVGRLSADRLALFYVDTPAAQKALERLGSGTAGLSLGPLGGKAQGATAVNVYAESDDLVIEAATPFDSGAPMAATIGESGLLPELPAGTWGGLGVPAIGGTVSTLLDGLESGGIPGFDRKSLEQQFKFQTGLDLQGDFLSWMGDAGIFAEGTNLAELGGGLVVESSDPATSSSTVTKLGALLERQGVPVSPITVGGAKGFSIQDPSLPQPVNVVAGEKVVVAYGQAATEQALAAPATLADSPGYKTAAGVLGEDYAPSGYFDLDSVTQIVEGTPMASDPSYGQDLKPWLDPLTYVVFGTKRDGDTQISRLVVGAD